MLLNFQLCECVSVYVSGVLEDFSPMGAEALSSHQVECIVLAIKPGRGAHVVYAQWRI